MTRRSCQKWYGLLLYIGVRNYFYNYLLNNCTYNCNISLSCVKTSKIALSFHYYFILLQVDYHY